MKTPCFQGLYASKQLQKKRTTSYKIETNNRRSGPKGRGFESRHFDMMKSLDPQRFAGRGFFFCPGGRGQFSGKSVVLSQNRHRTHLMIARKPLV